MPSPIKSEQNEDEGLAAKTQRVHKFTGDASEMLFESTVTYVEHTTDENEWVIFTQTSVTTSTFRAPWSALESAILKDRYVVYTCKGGSKCILKQSSARNCHRYGDDEETCSTGDTESWADHDFGYDTCDSAEAENMKVASDFLMQQE